MGLSAEAYPSKLGIQVECLSQFWNKYYFVEFEHQINFQPIWWHALLDIYFIKSWSRRRWFTNQLFFVVLFFGQQKSDAPQNIHFLLTPSSCLIFNEMTWLARNSENGTQPDTSASELWSTPSLGSRNRNCSHCGTFQKYCTNIVGTRQNVYFPAGICSS